MKNYKIGEQSVNKNNCLKVDVNNNTLDTGSYAHRIERIQRSPQGMHHTSPNISPVNKYQSCKADIFHALQACFCDKLDIFQSNKTTSRTTRKCCQPLRRPVTKRRHDTTMERELDATSVLHYIRCILKKRTINNMFVSTRHQWSRPWRANTITLLALMMVSYSLLLRVGECKYIEGELRTPKNWAFLGRFCFLSINGRFQFDVEYDRVHNSHQKLLLYYDAPHQWDAVYKTNKTCSERESVMKREHNQFVNLTLYSSNSDCEIMRRPSSNQTVYHCQGHRSFQSRRERWWYIAVSNCDSPNGLQLKYRLTFTNGFSFFYKHYSADEFYILRTDLTALLLELGMFFLSILAAAELQRRHLFHTTYRLYMYALVLQIISLIMISIHYFRYGLDGVGYPFAKLLGRMVGSLSTIVTVLFVLLMGKGFNITRGRLKQPTAVRLTIFMCLFVAIYGALFMYEQQYFDPGEVLYLYESWAGYGLVVLRLCAWIMFLYSCFFTLKHYPDKDKFYYPFMAFYTLWFIAGPVIILIANLVIDKWVREKVVNCVEMAVVVVGHAFFLFLTRPNIANSNFPYHVRTSQITAMEHTVSGKLGNNTLDNFCSHVYQPDLPSQKNFTSPDLFIVSGALQMRPVDPSSSAGSMHKPVDQVIPGGEEGGVYHHQQQQQHWPPTAPFMSSSTTTSSSNNANIISIPSKLRPSNASLNNNNIPPHDNNSNPSDNTFSNNNYNQPLTVPASNSFKRNSLTGIPSKLKPLPPLKGHGNEKASSTAAYSSTAPSAPAYEPIQTSPAHSS